MKTKFQNEYKTTNKTEKKEVICLWQDNVFPITNFKKTKEVKNKQQKL